MNDKNRYLYVLNPGMASGVAFVTGYEIDRLGIHGNDDLPEALPLKSDRGSELRAGTPLATRLNRTIRRWIRPASQRQDRT